MNNRLAVRPIQSPDRGWDDPRDEPMTGVAAILLALSSCVYFAALWLLAGLAPLPSIASGFGWLRGRASGRKRAHQTRSGRS